MERVLEGIKVLEVSAWAFVPSAGAVLADWGADVVKVEPPTGDPLPRTRECRHWRGRRPVVPLGGVEPRQTKHCPRSQAS